MMTALLSSRLPSTFPCAQCLSVLLHPCIVGQVAQVGCSLHCQHQAAPSVLCLAILPAPVPSVQRLSAWLCHVDELEAGHGQLCAWPRCAQLHLSVSVGGLLSSSLGMGSLGTFSSQLASSNSGLSAAAQRAAAAAASVGDVEPFKPSRQRGERRQTLKVVWRPDRELVAVRRFLQV